MRLADQGFVDKIVARNIQEMRKYGELGEFIADLYLKVKSDFPELAGTYFHAMEFEKNPVTG